MRYVPVRRQYPFRYQRCPPWIFFVRIAFHRLDHVAQGLDVFLQLGQRDRLRCIPALDPAVQLRWCRRRDHGDGYFVVDQSLAPLPQTVGECVVNPVVATVYVTGRPSHILRCIEDQTTEAFLAPALARDCLNVLTWAICCSMSAAPADEIFASPCALPD